jgi:hypothetical protein
LDAHASPQSATHSVISTTPLDFSWIGWARGAGAALMGSISMDAMGAAVFLLDERMTGNRAGLGSVGIG